MTNTAKEYYSLVEIKCGGPVGCPRGAVEGDLRPLSRVSRRNSPRRGRIPRPPPSRRPPTSSSRPSRTRRRVKSDAASGDNRVTPSTNAPPFRPNRSTAHSVDYRLDLCPCCGHDLQPMLDDCASSDPAGRHQGRAAGDSGASRSSQGGVLAVRSSSRHRCPSGSNAAAWSGPGSPP